MLICYFHHCWPHIACHCSLFFYPFILSCLSQMQILPFLLFLWLQMLFTRLEICGGFGIIWELLLLDIYIMKIEAFVYCWSVGYYAVDTQMWKSFHLDKVVMNLFIIIFNWEQIKIQACTGLSPGKCTLSAPVMLFTGTWKWNQLVETVLVMLN